MRRTTFAIMLVGAVIVFSYRSAVAIVITVVIAIVIAIAVVVVVVAGAAQRKGWRLALEPWGHKHPDQNCGAAPEETQPWS